MTLVTEREARVMGPREARVAHLLKQNWLRPRTLNIDALREVVDWVWRQRKLPKDNREWNQKQWRHCVAGYICNIYGAEWLDNFTVRMPYNDGYQPVGNAAMGLLGIDGAQAADLFDGMNGARRIRRIARSIARDAGQKLER